MACCSIDEYDNSTIRKHERTRRDKEDDRTRHMLMLRAQTGPVFLTYRNRAEIDEQVSAAITAEPLYDLTAADGVRHTIWRLNDTDSLVKSFESVPLLYIADGHHRAASASRARGVERTKLRAYRQRRLQLLSHRDFSGFTGADTCVQPHGSRSEWTLERSSFLTRSKDILR